MFFKIILFGIIVGASAYYFDLNSAPKKIMDAQFSKMETEDRCRQMDESMCKYYMTVKIPENKLEYTFRIPNGYYRMGPEAMKDRRFPLQVKTKKIFPEAVLGLAPKLEAEIAPQIK